MRYSCSPRLEQIFHYLEMFNQVVDIDEELASRLPETEFELSFTCEGDIYVDGAPLGVNIKQRYESLVLKLSRESAMADWGAPMPESSPLLWSKTCRRTFTPAVVSSRRWTG